MKQITRCFECGKRIKKQYNNLVVQNLPWHDYWGMKKYGTHEGCNIGNWHNSGRILYDMPIRIRKFLSHDYKINHDKYFPF